VVTGVIGDFKFAYDVRDDTVNTASRLEHLSEGGKINISEDLNQLVKDDFHFVKRGQIDAKNKGLIDMYFVGKKK
jgi:class 3 adenylate cyclase